MFLAGWRTMRRGQGEASHFMQVGVTAHCCHNLSWARTAVTTSHGRALVSQPLMGAHWCHNLSWARTGVTTSHARTEARAYRR
jgi:hypothetical protein